MKKYILVYLKFICLSMTIYAQDSTQLERRIGPECGCGGYTLGSYGASYNAFNDKDWDAINSKLEIFISQNDIKISRDYGYSNSTWSMLMRIQDIEWTVHKMDVLDYLDKFVKKILTEKSYLTKVNRNILYDNKGCLFKYGDPISIPFASYWSILKIDTKHGVNLINNTWEIINLNEPFSNKLRSDIIRSLKDYYRDADVQLLLEKIEKASITESDRQIINVMKDKYEFFKSQNEIEAWKKLLFRSATQSTDDLMSSENSLLWIRNTAILKDVFGEVNLLIPLELAEQEKDAKRKYVLTYSFCWLVNRKYPKKIDEGLIKRLDKLVIDVEQQCLIFKKATNNEVDFLKEAYEIVKKRHK